jgi:hypothetical protein
VWKNPIQRQKLLKLGFMTVHWGCWRQESSAMVFQGVNLVRRAIIEELTIADNADLQNHRAILQLSKTANQKHRLVTTNVDHGFLKADPAIPGMIDAAPKLPVPKPHKWTSVVHLHGIIGNDDPNGEQLIFTSGDFGSAYLTERWSSKFVTELFSHFFQFELLSNYFFFFGIFSIQR